MHMSRFSPLPIAIDFINTRLLEVYNWKDRYFLKQKLTENRDIYGYGSGYDIYPMPDLDIGSGYISTLKSRIWI